MGFTIVTDLQCFENTFVIPNMTCGRKKDPETLTLYTIRSTDTLLGGYFWNP